MFQVVQTSPVLVQDREGLAELLRDLGTQPRLAVDTESNSLHAYRERVCLIQFSTPKCDYVVDVLALADVGQLGDVFADPAMEKIFHAAEYDILCLRRDYGFRFANIFDTMQAGRILGRKLAGLDRLLEEKFQVKVSKRLQKADWGARPLTADQLAYAAQDTHYLIPLRDLLEQELREKDLLGLAREDFAMACMERVDSRPERAAAPLWVRFSGRRDLTPQDLTILNELLVWREAEAARLDRPPFKVLSDEKLIEIARARIDNVDDLEQLGLREKARQRWAADLLGAVARGLQRPAVQRARQVTPSAAYLKRLDDLKAWRKRAAEAMDVESDVVLPRALVLELAERGATHLETIMRPSPWRLRKFGGEISKVLQETPA